MGCVDEIDEADGRLDPTFDNEDGLVTFENIGTGGTES
jgi:hypothetical protein